MVRLEPAGMVIVPVAVPATMPMLNTRAWAMSGAVTSTTRVATAVADTSAVSSSLASAGVGRVSVGYDFKIGRFIVRIARTGKPG